jgi:ABC-type sugar transport system ATPase subunit
MQLTIDNISKAFGDNAVLKGIDLRIDGGEVVALVGENGAGKSTLTRIISGVYRPDGGSLSIDGETVAFRGPQDAMSRGIQVIYQEFRQNLFPNLSVAQNLYVKEEGRQFGRFLVSRKAMASEARKSLSALGMRIDPNAPVGRLGVAEQQMVEIAKAIGHHLNVLILDEPTAALDDRESEALFAQVKRLRSDGVGVVYISHRLDEVFMLADRIVVLRDGVVALTGATADLTPDQVVSAMVGRAVDDFYPKSHNAQEGAPALSLRGLSLPGAFDDVTLDVRPGEVLGLGGVLGSGRGTLLRALFGLERVTAGSIAISGRTVRPASPSAAIRAGIAYLTPERGTDGLCPQRSVAENVSLAAVGDFTAPAGFVRRRPERKAVGDVMRGLKVRAASPEVPVGTLSGGNQQKALFGKWVMTRPKVLLMEEPTRGVDVGAKTEIYRIINELTEQGVAVILVSSDLPELIAMSDRVLVMRAGRVTAELTGDHITQQAVLEHALEVVS